MKNCLRIPRILLPREGFEKWAVIACDQFTSDREYWKRVERYVGDAPSTLNFILPEAYLGENDEERIAAIRENMYAALESDGLVKYNRGVIFTERTTREGVRRGIVAALDLEAYSCEPGVSAPIRSSEEVLKDRLPPRVAVRRASPLEFPHALVFYRDKKEKIVKGLLREELEKLYDFDLMEGGGHVTGWFVPEYIAADVLQSMHAKGDPAFAVADGNHSVAAAKAHKFVRANGGSIDYIHGRRSLTRLAEEEGCVGVVLSPLEKDDFFPYLKGGVNFPKKAFSVGDGKSKRYYLEGREISYD